MQYVLGRKAVSWRTSFCWDFISIERLIGIVLLSSGFECKWSFYGSIYNPDRVACNRDRELIWRRTLGCSCSREGAYLWSRPFHVSLGLLLLPFKLVEVAVFPKDRPCHLISLLRSLLHSPRAHQKPRCGLQGSVSVLSHVHWKPPTCIQVCCPLHLHSSYPEFPQDTMIVHVFAQTSPTACNALLPSCTFPPHVESLRLHVTCLVGEPSPGPSGRADTPCSVPPAPRVLSSITTLVAPLWGQKQQVPMSECPVSNPPHNFPIKN